MTRDMRKTARKTNDMADNARVLGVYSKTTDIGSGMGGTAKKAQQKTYWFARMLPDDSYEVRPLNANHVPAGPALILSKKDFMAAYAPEPDYYLKKTQPALESLGRKLDKGEEQFKAGNLDAAEKEFCKALQLDDDNPRANIGLGAVYTQKSDFAKLKTVVRKLLGNDRVFQEEQRHLFNEFGTNLRKSGLLTESIAYYAKAIEFNAKDEHLYFNIARVHYDNRDRVACIASLTTALELNPDFDEARRFLNHCSAKAADQGPDIDLRNMNQ